MDKLRVAAVLVIAVVAIAIYMLFTKQRRPEPNSYTLASHLLFKSREGVLLGNFTATLTVTKMDSSINLSLTLMFTAPGTNPKIDELTISGFFHYFIYDLAKPPPPIPPPRPYKLTLKPGEKIIFFKSIRSISELEKPGLLIYLTVENYYVLLSDRASYTGELYWEAISFDGIRCVEVSGLLGKSEKKEYSVTLGSN